MVEEEIASARVSKDSDKWDLNTYCSSIIP